MMKRKMLDEFERGPAIVIQRGVRFWLRRRRGLQLVRYAITALQARYRTWGPKRQLVRLRALLGPNLGRMPSQLVALMPDKRGKLTKHRAFRPREPPVRHTTRILLQSRVPSHL